MTVYVVQEPQTYDRATNTHTSKFDFSSASEYGSVEVLLGWKTKPWDKSAVGELREKLRDFAPGDWLILAGNPCLIAAASAIVADNCDGTLRLLQYNGKERRYLPVVMELWDKE